MIQRHRIFPGFFPQTEAAFKCVCVVTQTTTNGKFFQIGRVAAAKNNLIRNQCGGENFNHIGNGLAPLLFAKALQAAQANVVLERLVILIWKMRQLHRQNLVANNKARTQASAQTKKQHLSAFVTAHRLHGGVVENFHGHAKVGVVIKVRPTLAKIGGVMQRPIVLNGRGDSHGHTVKLPAHA